MHLRLNSSRSVVIGPFVDSTDGDTLETGLTIANTDIQLSKDGATMADKNSGGGTHDANGWYAITLDSTDTDTVGAIQISIKVAGARPVFRDWEVIEEAVYDSIYASGATALATAASIGTPVTDVIADLNALIGVPTTSVIDDLTAWIGTPVTSISADLATAQVSIDEILVDTAEIGIAGVGLTDVALADATSDDVIADAVWNADTFNYGEAGTYGEHLESLTAGGDATEAKQDQIIEAVITNAVGVDISADIVAVKAETELIIEDTGTTIPTMLGNLNDIDVAAILAGEGDTGVSLAKAIELVAALVAGKVSVNSAAGVTTITYKKRDGTTTSFTTVVTEADKTRATTGALS